MPRYTDIDKLIAEYDRVHVGPAGGARKLMVEAPIADVVPRAVEAGYSKQSEGEWLVEKFKNGDMFINCSVCKSIIDCNYTNIDENEFDYCPYCGARMRGDKNE